jgi:hypothetical protein
MPVGAKGYIQQSAALAPHVLGEAVPSNYVEAARKINMLRLAVAAQYRSDIFHQGITTPLPVPGPTQAIRL